MKNLDDKSKHRIICSHTGIGKKVKWNEIYDTEEELVNDMMNENLIADGSVHSCRGYEYIKSFREYFKKNGSLTEKQMTQLKRLGYEIAYNLYI